LLAALGLGWHRMAYSLTYLLPESDSWQESLNAHVGGVNEIKTLTLRERI